MCELFALSASAPVDIKVSLGELARHGGETGIHAHGWGVAFLDGRDVRLVRDPLAAAYSPWVQCLQNHPIRSDTVLAHIRHATQGGVTLSNTQPFVRELWGRAHVFAHNGHLGEGVMLDSMRGRRFMPIGETDSEAAFCILMERLAAGVAPETNERTDHLFATFAAFAREMRDHGPANIIYASDGRLLVHTDRRTQSPGVIEPPGLWLLQRQCCARTRSTCAGAGVSITGAALHVALIASVPLTTGETWQPLDRGTVIELRNGCVVRRCREAAEPAERSCPGDLAAGGQPIKKVERAGLRDPCRRIAHRLPAGEGTRQSAVAATRDVRRRQSCPR